MVDKKKLRKKYFNVLFMIITKTWSSSLGTSKKQKKSWKKKNGIFQIHLNWHKFENLLNKPYLLNNYYEPITCKLEEEKKKDGYFLLAKNK